jgi:hypothetical protein
MFGLGLDPETTLDYSDDDVSGYLEPKLLDFNMANLYFDGGWAGLAMLVMSYGIRLNAIAIH